MASCIAARSEGPKFLHMSAEAALGTQPEQLAHRRLEPLCHQPYEQTEFVIGDSNGDTLVFAERH